MGTKPLNRLSGGPWAMIASDARGKVIGWNAEAERLLAVPAEEVLGKPCDEVLQGRDVFGNRFCKPDCSLTVMGKKGQLLHDFVMTIRTAKGEFLRAEMSVLTMSLGEPREDVVIHVIKSATKVMSAGA